MASYLEEYGTVDDRRAKATKIVVLSVLALLVVCTALTFVFYNYRQERQVKRFFAFLNAHEYQTAYALWVRSEDDRRGYSYESFLKDWGPQGENREIANYRIAQSCWCGSGVIVTVNFGNRQEAKLWVQREDLTIGFSPFSGSRRTFLDVLLRRCQADTL